MLPLSATASLVFFDHHRFETCADRQEAEHLISALQLETTRRPSGLPE